MSTPALPFMEAIERLQLRVAQLEAAQQEFEESDELLEARVELAEQIKTTFSSLSRWQRCQLARHPDRPYTLDYIHGIFADFCELHGDRKFGDDPSIIAGFATFDGESVAVVGHQKGRDTAEKVRRNFGMPRPEGYRKALRVMGLAAQFGRPVISFVDTPGAYPGIHAEERGQAEAIATNLLEMARLPVPILVIVTGEGGSGGALALGVGDRVMMLEHAIYSVISPEGCAAILWKDQARAEDAAEALKVSAQDLLELGVIDEILPEPSGGAQIEPVAMAQTIADAIRRHLKVLRRLKPEALVARRYKKFRAMGAFSER